MTIFKAENSTIMKHETTFETKNLALKYLIREPKVKTDKRKGIILLHGVSSNEKDLFGLTEHLHNNFYIMVGYGNYNRLNLSVYGYKLTRASKIFFND